MPLDDFIITVLASFLGGFLTKIGYDYFSEADLRYVEETPYPIQNNTGGIIINGLLVPIRIFNPKRKTLKDINVRVEVNSPIHSVTAKTDLAEQINCTPENRTMTSTIKRMNKGNFVVFFINMVDIESNPIKEISIQSNETNGKKFEYGKMSKMNELFGYITLIIGILIGTGFGMVITLNYIVPLIIH